jgi:hypothetical protein
MIFTHQNIDRYYQGLYLYDKVENKTVDITQTGTQYKFIAPSTPTPVNRFTIVTNPYIKNDPDLTSQIKIFSCDKTIFVDNKSNNNGDLYIYDVSGHFIKKVTFGLKSVTTVPLNLSTGAYIVKAISNGDDQSERVIIR